jgi:diguanylate cyclase (GGDEF)-like protein
MTSLFARADRALRRLPEAVLIAAAVAALLALASVKASTSWQNVPLVDFFLVPVAAVAWLVRSRAWGYAMAVLAAVLTVWVATAAGAPLAAGLVGAAVRLVYYLIVVVLVGEALRLVLAHREEARVDALTGIANMRAFQEAAEREIERTRRTPQPLSLLYLDVDHFKDVNDSFGHGAGDDLLRSIGHVLTCEARSTDIVARLGGDEFAVLMPETDRLAAGHMARRLREELARVRLPDERPVRCSIGVATQLTAPIGVQELLHHADELMYRAKQRGPGMIEAAQVAASPVRSARRRRSASPA